jgi:hypothetical protein
LTIAGNRQLSLDFGTGRNPAGARIWKFVPKFVDIQPPSSDSADTMPDSGQNGGILSILPDLARTTRTGKDLVVLAKFRQAQMPGHFKNNF